MNAPAFVRATPPSFAAAVTTLAALAGTLAAAATGLFVFLRFAVFLCFPKIFKTIPQID